MKKNLLTVAKRSIKVLDKDSQKTIYNYLLSQLNSDGGFKNRNGESDIYYTLFGLLSLKALGFDAPKSCSKYLKSFNSIQKLNFIDSLALLNSKKLLKKYIFNQFKEYSIIKLLLGTAENFRSKDGGYNHLTESEAATTAYGCYLAAISYEYTIVKLPLSNKLHASLQKLRLADGSYSNISDEDSGSVNATSAAISISSNITKIELLESIFWLMSNINFDGGFKATKTTESSDLLSTAVALYSISSRSRVKLKNKKRIYEYINILWNENGGFCSSIFDNQADSEYTFYGLLAIGSLSFL